MRGHDMAFRFTLWTTLLVLSTLFTLCHIHHVRPELLSLEDVIELSEQNLQPEEIIARIHESATVYELNTTAIVRLHDAGVDHRVVDEMLEMYRHALVARYRYYRDSYYPYPYYRSHYGFCGHCW